MVSAPIASAPPTAAKDFGKKKRANRSAKLKQCKLDARREQWLSQGSVKNKGCSVERQYVAPQMTRAVRKERKNSLEEENENGSIPHDFDSPANSPSSTSSVLGGTDSGTNLVASCTSSFSGSSSGCFSGNITEEEEEGETEGDGGGDDDNCLDDWEAMADALAGSDNNKQENPSNESSNSELLCSLTCKPTTQMDSDLSNLVLKQECPRTLASRLAPGNSQAWRPDDESRPQCLPNLAKQRSFPNADRHYGLVGGIPWRRVTRVVHVPSSCPICCEDLDYTDSSFLPCSCGFRLCLFCHKRILEEDGRCPGCRKTYEKLAVEAEASIGGGSLTFRLARSCSMIARS